MEWREGRISVLKTTRWLLWVGVLMLFPEGSQAVAADVEYRDFQIAVDGKPSGQYHMTIGRQDDGTFVVSGQADVRVSYLGGVYTYKYSYNGSETWEKGRLTRLESNCNDDGKRFAVSARADGNALRVTVNGQERVFPADVWTTSCWRLPDAGHRNRALTLLDVDSARQLAGNLQHVGTSRVNVAGQAKDCVHYRVTGGVQLELWFDAQERLVRQESMEDGHRTVLECTSLRR